MKTFTLKHIILVAFAALATFFASANPLETLSRGDEPIIIRPRPITSTGHGSRTPVYNPFFAYEDGTCVTLGSMSSYGVVSVTLVSTAGDCYQTFFDTEDLQLVIPISGSTGHYTLTLVTEGGLVFEGEFEV